MVVRRFHYLKKRFEKNLDLKIKYCDFLKEYKTLSHLSSIKNQNLVLPRCIKEDSVTTKTRVVFGSSVETSSGISLNNALKDGPTIQDDFFSLLIQFRSHIYTLTAEIEKVYRQVSVHLHGKK